MLNKHHISHNYNNDKLFDQKIIKDAIAALDLSLKADDASSKTHDLKIKIESNPNDMEARQELAIALYGSGEIEEALNCLLESISVNKDWNEEAARKQLLEFFSAIGNEIMSDR